VFQAPPPPPPPTPPEIVRTESSYLRVARKDVPVTLVREKASEKALIRYQLFVRTDVEATQPPIGEGPVVAEVTCNWTSSTYLQREPCFESLTGRLACGEAYTVRLEESARGSEKLLGEPTACGVALPAAAAAEVRLGAALTASAEGRFADDLARRLTPEFARAGVVAKPRPPK